MTKISSLPETQNAILSTVGQGHNNNKQHQATTLTLIETERNLKRGKTSKRQMKEKALKLFPSFVTQSLSLGSHMS